MPEKLKAAPARVANRKDVGRLADAAVEAEDRLKDEISRMFIRRAAARHLWHERWNDRDGSSYSG